MHPIDQRLANAGITLPQRSRPAGNYVPALRSGSFLYLSGQVPVWNGELRYAGQIGRDLSPEQGYEAARLAALNVLAHVRAETREWQTFGGLVSVEGHVSSAPGWYQQPKVLDGASDLFAEVLAEQGAHARAAFSCEQLPLNVAVELVVIAAVKEA